MTQSPPSHSEAPMECDVGNILTVVVLTKNEEADITNSVRSVTRGAELLLLDSGSSDGTIAAATAAPPLIPLRVETHPFGNYSTQRNVAIDLVRTPWLLFLDADEQLTPDLEAEIAVVLRQPDADAYWIPRRNELLGRWMRHTGWYPDAQLRLLRRDAVRYDPRRSVHEVAEVNGTTGTLHAHLIHVNYRSVREFIQKQRVFASYEAEQMRRAGAVRQRALVGQPLREFVRRYLHLQGYRDGWRGLLFSLLLAYARLHAVRLARAMQHGCAR